MFFLTITCHRWLSLFEMTDSYDVVYKWFNYLIQQGHYINGYVIMPNHLHALISFIHTKKSINRIVGDGKRFMAYDLVKRLKQSDQGDILKLLSHGVNPGDRLKGKLHQVFEPSFDWKVCWGSRFIEQKLNYIHNNPCQGSWRLVTHPVEYQHSSAMFYDSGVKPMCEVTNYMKIKDIDLSALK